MKLYVVYHCADFDGVVSAVITAFGMGRNHFEGSIISYDENLLTFVPYNYGPDLKVTVDEEEYNLIDVIEKNDLIFFVDCCYTRSPDMIKEMIKKVNNPKDQIFLIDHHETSIAMAKEFWPEINFEASLSSSGSANPKSAALLCWEFFYKDELVPQFLNLISNYDVWYRDDGKWDSATFPFQQGLRSEGLNLKKISGRTFDRIGYLLYYSNEKGPNNDIERIINKGIILIDKIKADAKILIKSYSKDVNVSIGDKTYLAKIGPGHLQNSTLFEYGLPEEAREKYDIFILERPDMMRGNAIISIISNRDDINAAKLCEALGGGGHFVIGSCTVTYNDIMYDEVNNIWSTTLKRYDK